MMTSSRRPLRLIFLAAVLVSFATARAQELPPGQILDDVKCLADPSQSYALYLPSNLSSDRAWSLVIALHPGARGRAMVEKFQTAADQFGYIIAGSNNARNGPTDVSVASVQAMSTDLGRRFRIDPKRVYLAGMSGGARVATLVALQSDQIAGVIAWSAGYPDAKPRKSVPFAVFGTAGTEDFNHLEMVRLDQALTSPHRLEVFEGGHALPPASLANLSLEWMELQAIKAGRAPRDQALIDMWFSRQQAAAEALANPKDRALALKHIADDFAGLHDVAAVAARAAEWLKQKDVKTALNREKSDDDHEAALMADILQNEADLRVPERRFDSLSMLGGTLADLSKQANNPIDSSPRRMARRVLRSVAMGAAERTQDPDYLKLVAKYRLSGLGAGGVQSPVAMADECIDAQADVVVTVDRNQGAAATHAFKFDRVPSPVANDAAAKAKYTIVVGERDDNSPTLSALIDGLLPHDEDEPGANFFFNAGTPGGRFVLDLGAVMDVSQVNTYSWHPNTRGPQVYTLYVSDGSGAQFNAAPKHDTDPTSAGWLKVASIDTIPKSGDDGGQYGVSITDRSGSLGKVRYLLFVCAATEAFDDYGNTFYSEIDVIARQAPPVYETRAQHDPDGTGRFYMGREIAQVMGHQAASWLERPDRMDTEQPDRVVREMQLRPTDVVADVGAGTGYFSFRLSRVVTAGRVIAADIQPEMLAMIQARRQSTGIANVDTLLSTETDAKLPAGAVDVVLLVDAYHEFAFPREMMASIVGSLKPGGRVVQIEYRAEDPDVLIKPLHKMTVAQARKEMTAAGLTWKETKEFLPQQHFIVYEKR